MIGHGEIADAHAHAVTKANRQRIDAGKHAAVPGPHVEISHLVHLRQIGAGIDQVRAHDEDEVAIDRAELDRSRGCTTIIPIMPIAIWTISSECGWYMNVPLCFISNS